VVAKLSRHALSKGKSFHELPLKEYRKFSPLFARDVYRITVQSAVAARDAVGGTSPRQVGRALKRAKRLAEDEKV
jgi:argininosuccinate lyase